jgi:CRISPR-associated protein Csn2
MRFVYSELGLDINIPEDKVFTLTLEKPDVFSKILSDLWMQISGLEGETIISEEDAILKLSKVADMIFNPFGINCNDRKILNAIYSEMKAIASEDQIESFAEINRQNIDFIDNIGAKLDYAITYELEVDVADIFKMYEVKLLTDDDGLVSKIIDYIKLLHRILKTNIFIFVNLKQYLTDNEIKSVYEAVIYEKVQLVVVQANYCDKISCEYNIVVDADLCVIEP